MGVAVLSGVMESLEPRSSGGFFEAEKWETHTPGTLTPSLNSNPALPSRFVATVNTEGSARRLRKHFATLGSLGPKLEISVGHNVEAARHADVILLWYVHM
jgi:pyrroline-5-carboxylate reductase